jgi:hypothetical protein
MVKAFKVRPESFLKFVITQRAQMCRAIKEEMQNPRKLSKKAFILADRIEDQLRMGLNPSEFFLTLRQNTSLKDARRLLALIVNAIAYARRYISFHWKIEHTEDPETIKLVCSR